MQDTLTTAQLIARGRSLHQTISAAQAELKSIETILRSRALAIPHAPLKDAHREGRRATLSDDGHTVTVAFESDILKASFCADSPLAQVILDLLSEAELSALFRRKNTFERSQKDGHKFRRLAAETLAPSTAATLIEHLKDRDKNGITKSKTVIEWDV